MNAENYKVLAKIIGAVETGGQIYGKARYNDYTPPYKNTPNEHTITLGWAQNYGPEAEKLIHMIYNKDKAAFARLDTATPSISSMLGKNWAGMRWKPTSGQRFALISIIDSKIGHECQDELFSELMKKFVADCERDYTNNVPAVMMYCEIRHLGGKGPADRIFKRCKGNYSLENIMAALKQDQNDTSSSNQVGDKIFWSRHQKCVEFIKKYAVPESGKEKQMTPLQRAKVLLRQPQGETMTGYTPTGKQYFVNAGAWTTSPKRGDVIYFYSSSKGRVGHTGIVEKVDASTKTVYTIEGNTSSTAYAENGGCVARHSYSYAATGGRNRVNGFGRPNFAGAGVTADQFVNAAVANLGYREKRSNSQLDSKTANAGANNYQKFQRDVGAGNGDQWCQYFVDATALYTCQNGKTPAADGIRQGDTGDKVKTLQKMLIKCGYSCGEAGADGTFGNKTLAAVKAFQKDHKLTADGVYGPATKVALEKEYKAKTTKKTAKDITRTKFLESCKNVMDTARTGHYKYGNSTATNPTTDKIISCDRLVAKALYDLGFTDQRKGGEVCSTLDKWLNGHGFIRSTDPKDIKKGSILLVKHSNDKTIGHVFVNVKYNKTNWVTDRYDAGSQERINTEQPLKNVPWGYRKDDIIIYNIPVKTKRTEPEKKETWTAKGTATATVNDLNVREKPDANSKILITLNKGNRFELDGKTSGKWSHAKVVDKIGWIYTSYIKKD